MSGASPPAGAVHFVFPKQLRPWQNASMARLPAKAKALVYSNLEKYARSGMGMEKACESLLGQPRLPAATRRLYRDFLGGIRRGQSLADALASAGPIVSPLEREIVAAAESGGRLEQGFAHLAEYFRRLDRTRRRIVRGLAYPIVLVHLAIPVSTLAVTVFRSFRLDGEGPTSVLGDAVAAGGRTMLAAWGAFALLLAGGWALHRLGRRSPFVDGLLRGTPLLGKARLAAAMERFSKVFEIFLLSGRTMSDSLAGAARASESGLVREAGLRGAALAAAGEPLAEAVLVRPNAFPSDFVQGIAAAEESGQLDRELDGWSRHYGEAAGEAMDQLAEWTPKLVYWAVLGLVAWLVLRAAFAYRDLIEGLLNFGT